MGRKDEGSGRGGRYIDFLGYQFSQDDQRLRKSIKQKFAKSMARVKSRKRKKQLTDSYRGWCMYGRCRNLWKTITGQPLMGFADKGISIEQASTKDGKKFFECRKGTIMEVLNQRLSVLDFEANVPTPDIHDPTKMNYDRYMLMVQKEDGEKIKFTISSFQMKNILDECRKAEDAGNKVFPVENVGIARVDLGRGKFTYKFIDL